MIVKSRPGFLSKLPTSTLKSLKFCIDIAKYLGFGLWWLGGLIAIGIFVAMMFGYEKFAAENSLIIGSLVVHPLILILGLALVGLTIIWIISASHDALEFALFDRSRLPAASAKIVFHEKNESKWEEISLTETRERYSRSERSPHKNLTSYSKPISNISLRVCLETFSYRATSTEDGELCLDIISGFGNLSLLDVGSRRYKKLLGTDVVPTLSVFGEAKTSLIRYEILSSEAHGREPNTYRYIPYERLNEDYVDQKRKLVSVCLQIALPKRIIKAMCEINATNEVGSITLNVGTQKSDGLYDAGGFSRHYKVLFDSATVEIEKVAGESKALENGDLKDDELKKHLMIASNEFIPINPTYFSGGIVELMTRESLTPWRYHYGIGTFEQKTMRKVD